MKINTAEKMRVFVKYIFFQKIKAVARHQPPASSGKLQLGLNSLNHLSLSPPLLFGERVKDSSSICKLAIASYVATLLQGMQLTKPAKPTRLHAWLSPFLSLTSSSCNQQRSHGNGLAAVSISDGLPFPRKKERSSSRRKAHNIFYVK